MKYAEMLPLMGQVVTVTHILHQNYERKWKPQVCKPWSGWVVGFRWKMDGHTTWEGGEEPNVFHEDSRQLAVIIASWPTKLPIPVPLDGYSLGGTPKPPDNGGWKAYKARRAD